MVSLQLVVLGWQAIAPSTGGVRPGSESVLFPTCVGVAGAITQQPWELAWESPLQSNTVFFCSSKYCGYKIFSAK